MNHIGLKADLGTLYGKKCFIIDKEKRLTYHHLFKKEDGGEDTVENGAILNEDFHQWLHHLEISEGALFKMINETISIGKLVMQSGNDELIGQLQYVKGRIKDRFKQDRQKNSKRANKKD